MNTYIEFRLVPTLQRHCPQLSIVGAGHARDEEAKDKHCSQNIAGMAGSYGVIVLNLMAVTPERGNDSAGVIYCELPNKVLLIAIGTHDDVY